MDDVAKIADPVCRTVKILRRMRRRDDMLDRGNWRGMSEIASGVGAKRETVRGYLVKLVAAGIVEVSICANGTYWRARVEAQDA